MEEIDSPPGTVMDNTSPANDVGSSSLSIKSPTPSQKAREWEKRINQSMGDYPSKPNGELEKCSNCGRGFAKERIDKHIQICKNTKERQIYDIAQARVEGTEAGELYKAGKLQLEKPKPMEKKSALTAKINSSSLNKDVLPPITANPNRKVSSHAENGGNATAYQVTFDENDKIKTKKNKFSAPLNMIAPTRTAQDERFLSTKYDSQKRWRSAAMRISPALSAKMKKGKKHTANGHAKNGNYPMGPHTFDIGEEEDEEDDFLAASWASSKTVCSDAFDFLFDEKNMNPENVLEKHPDVIEVKPDKDFGKTKSLQDGKVQQSKCCVIS